MAGVIMIRKMYPKPTVVDLLIDLGRILNKKGYNTKEKVNVLINEVKLEVMDEWEKKIKRQSK